MWTLSPECYSIARLYCFKNPKLEAQYQCHRNSSNLWNTQVHYCNILFSCILHCISYVGTPLANMPVPFWLGFSLAMISFGCAVASITMPPLKRRTLLVHFVFCLICICIFSVMISLNATAWQSSAYQAWVPAGGHLIVQKSGQEVISDGEFFSFLSSLYSVLAIAVSFSELGNIWLFLAITGLNIYSVAGFTILMVAIIPSFTTVPIISPISIALDISTIVSSTITYLILAVVIERTQRSKALVEHRLVQEMRASQTADSVLNHSLKNTMADVAGHIETYCGGHATMATLEDAMACLRRGMRICKERQVFLQLAAGNYHPMRNVVPLREFGEQLLAGRNVAARFLDLTVYVDSTLLSLVLDNALSNAFKHGLPGNPQVEFEISEVDGQQMSSDRFCWIQFVVRNAVDPTAEPLTPAFVQGLFSGRHQSKREVPVLSNGIGFSHALMAAKLAGATIDLHQEGHTVVFSATIAVQEATALTVDVRDSSSFNALENFPRGLRFFVLDDSGVARRLLQFLITAWCDPSTVRIFGEKEADVELLMSLAVHGADVLIIDQHLDFEKPQLGTDVVQRLRSLGFQGFICIRSAADTPEDQQKFREHGANCSFGKDMPGPQFIEAFKEAFLLSRQGLVIINELEMEQEVHPCPRMYTV